MRPIKDMLNVEYDSWRVVSYAGKDKSGFHRWNLKCSRCGNVVSRKGTSIRHVNIAKCKCYRTHVTVDGIRKPLVAWAEQAGIHPHTIATRVSRGMSLKIAVAKAKRPPGRVFRPLAAGVTFPGSILTTTGAYRQYPGRNYQYECKCECGNVKWIRGTALIHGLSRSCGCAPRKKKNT